MTHDADRVTGIEVYCLGKIISECGEFAQVAGNALCFGLDTPDHRETGRARIEEELGDIHAAITFAVYQGVISGPSVAHHSRRKLQTLLDPTQADNSSRPLAPHLQGRFSDPIPPIPDPPKSEGAVAEETIVVSTQVADALRKLTNNGQVTVDTLLRRLLKIGTSITYDRPGPVGYHDPGTGVVLPEGFQIFRRWQGETYRATAHDGQWVTPDG